MMDKKCKYEKTIKFFRSHPLHQYFEKQGGSFRKAIENSNSSLRGKYKGERDYTYSEMGEMFELLGIN